MKKSMRILALVLAALMLVGSFAACGEKSGNAGENVLVIGGIGPLTGSAASYGQGVMKGAQLAVDEINKAGGVNGMQLSLNFQDDEHTTDKAVNAYNTLKDKGMKLLMGTVTSNPCVAVAEKTHEDNMFQLTPSGSSVACTQYDNAFRICFNDPNQGTVSAQYIAENNIASKIAIIYDSSDVYSSGIKDKFVAEAANRNLEIVATEAFTSDSKTDFSVQLQKIQASGAELVFLPIYYSEAAMILSQANKNGLDVKWFGCDGLDGLIAQLGDEVALADDVMLLTPFVADAQDVKTSAFVSAYKAANNDETPNQFAADAYDAIYAIKAALEKAGVTDASISASDLCDLLVPAMTQIQVVGVTGTMTWDAAGEPTKEPKGMKIENGAYTAM